MANPCQPVPTRDDGDANGLVRGHFLCQRHAWAQKRAHPTPILPRLIEKLLEAIWPTEFMADALKSSCPATLTAAACPAPTDYTKQN